MKILIVRHGSAKDREKWHESGGMETQRPLSKRGEKKMELAAAGLHKLVEHVDVIMNSTYERSIQTATIFQEQFGLEKTQKSSFLEPGVHPQELVDHIREYPDSHTMMLVGHEPGLSGLVAYLTAGRHAEPFLYFRKGTAALLECEGLPDAARCSMKWFVTRQMLEDL